MDTQLNSFSRRLLLLGVAASLSACAQTSTPRWDSTFGDSVRSMFAAQVVNPAGVRNTDPVAGMDGRAARSAQEKYERGVNGPEHTAMPASLMSGSTNK